MNRNAYALSCVTLADLIARSAYQMGKSPLLPIFAAALGATDVYLGLIVSVSTLTGMILKPVIGFLSDHMGRRIWILGGTAVFAFVPFVYQFIDTPEQLVVVRVVHGLATAIYGPVTLALVAEQASTNKAERLGWFGMARSTGYVIGPAVAGWLLLTWEATSVFTLIGLVSSLAFVPVLLLPAQSPAANRRRPSLAVQAKQAWHNCCRVPAVWLSGGLESAMYIITYAVRAFLPIYALSIGINVAWVGTFFALQEAVHMVAKPLSGRLGDRVGYLNAIALGMLLLGLPLLSFTYSTTIGPLLVASALIGVAQALLTPAAVALVSVQIDQSQIGAGMGMIGTLKNAGKVAGPIVAGLLIAQFDYSITFSLLSLLAVSSAIIIFTTVKGRSLTLPSLSGFCFQNYSILRNHTK